MRLVIAGLTAGASTEGAIAVALEVQRKADGLFGTLEELASADDTEIFDRTQAAMTAFADIAQKFLEGTKATPTS